VQTLPLAEAPPMPDTAWGTVPHLAPLVELAGERTVCLVAYTDRQGCDFELRTADRDEPAGTVQGLDWPLHRTSTADWSEQHFQEAVEQTWERNAAETAEALAEVAAEHQPDLVLLAGDTRQRRAVQDRLPAWLTPRVAQTRHGGRAPGSSTPLLDEEIARLLAERRQLRQAETLDRFHAGLQAGHDGRAEPGRAIAVGHQHGSGGLFCFGRHQENRSCCPLSRLSRALRGFRDRGDIASDDGFSRGVAGGAPSIVAPTDPSAK
jgi:hypothetical protein